MAMTIREKGLFLSLFNRRGYVLNFTTNDFDVFTMRSVGISLCETYKESKGKSLTRFVKEEDDVRVTKLKLTMSMKLKRRMMPGKDLTSTRSTTPSASR